MNVWLPPLKYIGELPWLVNRVTAPLAGPLFSVSVPYDWKLATLISLRAPIVTDPAPSLVNPLRFNVLLVPLTLTPAATAKAALLSKCTNWSLALLDVMATEGVVV